MVELKEENRKIPIKIIGANNFAIVGGAGGLSFGTFCGRGYCQNLEEGVHEVIEMLRFNANVYLKRMVHGLEDGESQDIAFKIINYKGRIEDLFFLEYDKYWQEYIEPKLGRLSKLERIIK